MSKVFLIHKKHLVFTGTAILLVAAALFWGKEQLIPALADSGPARTIHMVTGEFASKTADGKSIEVYRLDPGTIVVHKGEKINLSIFGVNGDSHPFIIEGLNVKGEVKKGKETVVSFTAQKAGIYRIICTAHPDIAHNGPMVAYIVVN
ncbi:cupredoxin domain-containing protein [Paenibacillus sp. GP183]|jgi:plastocyanin|uniref:cupredoxin domain-containing protein n=1 Tax=Paenibacillus sp. GP183 TaxID=1882751 RepID=UPI000897F5BD|nr:cupredoxin domain-containing protein [Paenibacillus sp. GP183]SEC57624.1 Cupredoxin-like domain-containing protein [Paenibacillus sp. GP183]